ncbi:hypothetical protein JTE90_016829 [Oedothorax gibbosus]|uniref:Vacuolar protein sorting-associated protein 26 n=1 Tax=Oedothorax gibbosus TaxID=931172 RepID=A0AAV6VXM0_9ARAC|nr:hypothetical protein JTE90_016829 [Oedothorax gibbosus]
MSNTESQENELLSLQSIFEEGEFSVDRREPPSGRIIAEVRLPDGYFVTATKFEQSDMSKEKVFHVDHLPPIILFYEFPHTYPEVTCPTFFISCNWLSFQQISLLCKKLVSFWEMSRDVILYIWMQFLKDEALDFLNIKQCLDISQLLKLKINENFIDRKTNNTGTRECPNAVPSISGGCRAFDLCAMNELSDGKLIIQILKDYDEYKKEIIFNTSIQECKVCLLKKKGLHFERFKPCNHYFCKDCVKEFFEALILEGSITKLKCLQGECSSELDESSFKKLVRPDLYKRYDRLLLSTTLESMSDITYCPRKDCQCACIIDTCGRMGTCPACRFVFCPFCKMTYHGVAPCNFKSEQRKRIFDEYTKGDFSVKASMEKCYGKRVLKALVEDTLSERWKTSNSQNCPHCRATIEKDEGCNKMTCIKCGSVFCWLCMKVLSSSNPYTHYSDSTSECKNMLFPANYMEDEFEDVQPGEFLDGYEIEWNLIFIVNLDTPTSFSSEDFQIAVNMSLFGFGQTADIDIVLDGADSRKMADIKTEEGKKERHYVFYDGESVSGKINVTLRKPGVKLEHQGIKVEFLGQIELYYDKGNHHEFTSLIRDLARPGDLLQNTTYSFDFVNVEKPYESYTGTNVRLRYFLRVTIVRRLSDIVKEFEIIVHTLSSYPEINSSIKMEVGIEDCLHIEFEYNKSKYHLKDVIVGKIYFLLVRIKIRHMEIAIIKRETTGSGPNSYSDTETVAKYEIMDGAPVRGESIPIRVFLAGYDLTPTMKDINKKFSVRYYLNLVLVDEEDRRYFKQQEIVLWRKGELTRKAIQQTAPAEGK